MKKQKAKTSKVDAIQKCESNDKIKAVDHRTKRSKGKARVNKSKRNAKLKKTVLEMKSGNYTRSRVGIVMDDDNGDSTKICSYIRCVAHLTCAESGKVMVKVKFKDIQGQYKYVSIPRADFNSAKGLIDQLVNVGFCVYDMPAVKEFMAELYQYESPKKNNLLVSRTGWHPIAKGEPKAFVVNGNTFQPEGSKCNIVLDGGESTQLSSKGTIDDWRKNVAALCQGNPRLIFLVSATVSGPLLDILDYHNVGLHIFGQSRAGKTTGLIIAGSVYGDRQFCSSWYATTNALPETALARNDLVLLLDEISQCPEKAVSAAAYDLMNGKAKSRLGSESKLKLGDNFRVVVLSTGENSLEEHLQQGGIKVKPGQLARLISIPVNYTNGMFKEIHGSATQGDFAAMLLKNADANYGTAGPEFIGHLVEDQQQLKQALPAQVHDIENKLLVSIKTDEPTALQRSVAKSMAVIACAGELAISYGVFPWSEGDATTAAKVCYKAWNAFEKSAENERNPAFPVIKQYFQDNHDTFLPLGKYTETGTSNYTHKVDGTRGFLVTPAYFEKNLCSKFGKKAGIDALKQRRLLVLSSRGGPTRQVPIPKRPKLGKPSFFVIRSSILTAK